MECVYCAIGAKYLNVIQVDFNLQTVNLEKGKLKSSRRGQECICVSAHRGKEISNLCLESYRKINI